MQQRFASPALQQSGTVPVRRAACLSTLNTPTAMLRLLVTAALASALCGCATQTKLDQKVTLAASDIRLVDNRSPEKKAHKRDSVFSALALMDDEKFSPRALDLFQAVLLPDASLARPINIEVDEFRIGDFFPVRLGAGGQGFLGAVVFEALIDKNTDWAFANEMKLAPNTDALLCVFVGRLNGVPIKVAASETYKISPFAALVVNDPDYRRALDVVIRRAAEDALRQQKSRSN